jgi:hypothetical protein
VSSPDQNSALTLFHRIANWFTHHEGIIPWFLFSGLVALYLTFPTRNYYWDGIAFAQTIEDGNHFSTTLIHPNHLIYNVLGYLFYHVLHLAGLEIRAITALQILNGILSAMSAVVLFVILRRSLRSLYLSTFLTLLFALSATWWKFSVDADAYIVSVLFLLLSFYFLLPDRTSRPVVVAFLFSLSMCFHQLAILFGPVILFALIFQQPKVEKAKKLATILKFSLVSFVLTTTAYFFCFYIATGKPDLVVFLHWITSYSPDASFTFNIWDDLRYTLRGHTRLFLNGRFNLIKGLINPFIISLMALLVTMFCVFCYLLIKNFKQPRLKSLRSLMNNSRSRPLFILTMAWVLIYLTFLFVWLPQNTFYRLFYLPALIVLAGLFGTARYDFGAYRPTYRLAIFTISVALANFLFLIFPYSHAEKFPPTRFALDMSKEWPAGTVIYYYLENSDKSLVRYFSPSTTWTPLKDPAPEYLDNQLSLVYPKGSTVWLETTAIDRLASTPEGVQWLVTHAKKDVRRELKEKGFRIEYIQVEP